MQRSPMRLAAMFWRNKQRVNIYSSWRVGIAVAVSGSAVLLASSFAIIAFAVPTHDIIYDYLFATSMQFRRFVDDDPNFRHTPDMEKAARISDLRTQLRTELRPIHEGNIVMQDVISIDNMTSTRPPRARKSLPAQQQHRRADGPDSWMCIDCSIVFVHEPTYREHMQLLHDSEYYGERQHLCWDCGELMPTIALYHEHMVRHDLVAFVEKCNEQCRRREIVKRRAATITAAGRNVNAKNEYASADVVKLESSVKFADDDSSSLAVPVDKRARIADHRSPAPAEFTGSQCPVCNVLLTNANIMIAHAVNEHNAQIRSVELCLYRDETTLHVCQMQPKRVCDFCAHNQFGTDADYFLHLTTMHRSELFMQRPDADRFVLLVETLFRDQPSFMISICVRKKTTAS